MSTNSLIGGAIGGVIGFFVAGPAGAAVGFGAGIGLGAALTPMQMPGQQGPRLSDLKVQTSTYGAAIPRVYGTVGITGNVIWLEGNRLKEVVSRRKVKAGGKGGSKKTTVTTYTYYATLAIGLCEGPIAGVRRIWAGPNLIYDAGSGDLETVLASNGAASNFSIYLGSADQQPDSRIQADRGVANTPAYRGLAYVVIKDFLLSDYGNAIPAFKVDVVNSASAETYVLMDAAPYTVGGFSHLSGVAFDGSLEQFRYIHRRTEEFVNLSRLYAGNRFDERQALSALDVNPGSGDMQGCVSYGATAWGSYESDDLANTRRLVDSSGRWVENAHAGHMNYVTTVGENTFVCLLTDSIQKTTFDRIGRFFAGPDATAPYQIFSTVVVGSGFRAATAGDAAFAYQIDRASQLIRWKIYDESLDEGAVNSAPIDPLLWGDTGGALHNDALLHMAEGGRSEYAVMRDGVIYLAYRYASGMFRIGAFRPGESLAVYEFSSGSHAGPIWAADFMGPYQGVLMCGGAAIQWARSPGGGVALGEAVGSECELAGLLPQDIDSGGLQDMLLGYRVSVGTIRSALEPLRAAYPFDAYQSGYQVSFAPRGAGTVATIAISELGVDEQLPQSREMDAQLPARMAVSYLDAARNYDANEQFAERISTEAVNDSELELAIVMTASQAAQAAERLLSVAWMERVIFGPFQLPPKYRHLEAADVITVDAGYALYEMRLTEVSYNADGSLTCSAVPNNAAVYLSEAASDETPSTGRVTLAGDSLFVPLDIPVIDESIQDSAGFVGAATGYTSGWPGAVAVQTVDGGQTWAEIQAFDGKATLGYVTGSLAAHGCALIDERAITVELVSGEMESVTEAQMLAGTNWAAYGADGRWEIVRFRDAVLQSDGSYLLSGFKRGDKGTEWATGLHQEGDLFVSLDDGDLAAIGMPVESIGVASTWRGVTAGGSVDTATDVPFTYRGVNLECLSPVYPVASRNGDGDLALSWTRRSRLSSSWWATGTAAPLGESSESYEVDIHNGSAVARTIASGTPSITYTAAQQLADFGSAQASIAIRIYQISAVVGRGYPLEVTA